jgi:hypothetical protein
VLGGTSAQCTCVLWRCAAASTASKQPAALHTDHIRSAILSCCCPVLTLPACPAARPVLRCAALRCRNPSVEDQAADRVHRLGQTRPVEVLRYVARGTIEERLLELQVQCAVHMCRCAPCT